MLVNKYAFFAVMVVYIILTSIMVSALGFTAPVIQSSNIVGLGASTIFQVIGGFISILTFSVTGIPTIINLIFFGWVPFVIGFMIIDVIKDTIPFT